MKNAHLFMLCFLIPVFHLHSQVYFSDPIIICSDVKQVRSVCTSDIDGDGDLDVVSASFDDDKIAWCENTDGKGAFGALRIISTLADAAWSVFTADMDGDGDMDVLSASAADDKIAWYENIDGLGSFGPQKVITTAADGATSVFAADMDGDGDRDVLSASSNDNKIAWYQNTDGKGVFGEQHIISTKAVMAASVRAADIDQDGDMDVVSASATDDKIAWYENTDGRGSFGSERVITTLASFAVSVFTSDLDGDGDMDVLSASVDEDKIAWYDNMDGKGAFGPQKVISKSADAPWSVHAADIDGDGDQDVLSASYADSKIAWYENTDGKGAFGAQQVISMKANGTRCVYSADIDHDGRMDVLSTWGNSNKITWFRNREPSQWDGLFTAHLIDADFNDARSVFAADIDGDGDGDIIGAAKNLDEIAWYEHLDQGSGTFFKRIIDTNFDDAGVVFAADMDGDKDMDVLGGTVMGKEIAWWENADSVIFIKHTIDGDFKWSRSVYAADMDSDGDMDVLAVSELTDDIAWWQNDGSKNFSKRIVDANFTGVSSIYATDIDRDGDIDIAGAGNTRIAWWENDGSQTFSKHGIGEKLSLGICVFARDLDNDGDVDVVSVDKSKDEIAWWENNGSQIFTKQVVDSTINQPNQACVADMDKDGDQDILAVSYYDGYVCCYENLGAKKFSKHIIYQELFGASSVHAADLDGDGDPDIMAASSLNNDVFWFDNTLLTNSGRIVADILIKPDTLHFVIGPNARKENLIPADRKSAPANCQSPVTAVTSGNEDEAILSIMNRGQATLYVQNISTEHKWITDIDTANFLIKPGDEFSVRIRCSGEGMFNDIYTGVLKIQSNDPDIPVLAVPMVLDMKGGLEVHFVPEAEPNNNENEAQRLAVQSPVGIKGNIATSDHGKISVLGDDIEDLYVFTIQSPGLKINLYDLSADLDVVLMQIAGTTITIWGSNHRGSTVNEQFDKLDLAAGTYFVGVTIYDKNPIESSSSYNLVLLGDFATKVKRIDHQQPRQYALGQNYPNPFNPFTTINFQVPVTAHVTIKIYDALGREVRTLIDALYLADHYTATWDGLDNLGRKASSGVYWYCMESNGFKDAKKALLMK